MYLLLVEDNPDLVENLSEYFEDQVHIVGQDVEDLNLTWIRCVCYVTESSSTCLVAGVLGSSAQLALLGEGFNLVHKLFNIIFAPKQC